MTSPALPLTEAAGMRAGWGRVFLALLARDAVVLSKNLAPFLARTVLQPFVLVFVFTYVFPKIGQGVGQGAGSDFSTLLVAGVVGTTVMFQGVQAVALPLVQDFGYTREVEDRVLAPMPIAGIAIAKIASGALQCLAAGVVVFPVAAFVPAAPVDLDVDWLVLVTILPLSCVMAASLGLVFGTTFEPRTVSMLFSVVIVPLTFLGCTYYSWQSLAPIRWLQVGVLANPLTFVSEGLRGGLTSVSHLSLLVVYPVIVAFIVAFTWLGVRGFTRRVVS